MHDQRLRDLDAGGHRVVGQRARQEAAVAAVVELLVQRRAHALREGAADLAVDQRRIEQAAGVVRGHVAVDAHAAGVAVDLHAAQVEHEAVGGRRVHTVLRVGRGQRLGREHGGGAQAGGHAGGQQRRRPVGQPGHARQRLRLLGPVGHEDASVGEAQRIRRAAPLRSGDARQLVAQFHRRQMHGAGHRAGKAARVVAGSHRPGVLVGVELDVDHHRLGRDAERVGHHLRAHGHVALAGGRGGDRDGGAAQQVDRHRGGGDRAVLRAGLGALLGCQRRRDVAHVGDRRLDDGGAADAVQPALRAQRGLVRLQRVECGGGHGVVGDRVIVAGVEQRAGGSAIRELLAPHVVAAAQVDRIDLQLRGDAVDQSLEREVDLRAAEAAHQPGRRLVEHGHAVAHRQARDVVRAGQRAMHPVEGGRLGRAKVGAHLVDLVVAQRQDAAVGVHCGLDLGGARGGAGGGGQVLDPVLDPLDRRAGLARGQAHQHRDRKHRLLDAEAAARVARYAVAQLVGRYLQRQCHHRVQRERPHEVGDHVIGAVGRQPLGDRHAAFDRCARVARIACCQPHHVRGAREGRFRLAIAEAALADDIAARFRMQQRRIGGQRGVDRHHRRQRRVLDHNALGAVLGLVAVLGDHHRHRLAHIADALLRQRPVVDRRLDAGHERLRPAPHVLAGEHRAHAAAGERRARVDRAHFGMRVRRAHDRRVQRARLDAQVVGKLAAAAQQRRIFHALSRPPQMGRGVVVNGVGSSGHAAAGGSGEHGRAVFTGACGRRERSSPETYPGVRFPTRESGDFDAALRGWGGEEGTPKADRRRCAPRCRRPAARTG